MRIKVSYHSFLLGSRPWEDFKVVQYKPLLAWNSNVINVLYVPKYKPPEESIAVQKISQLYFEWRLLTPTTTLSPALDRDGSKQYFISSRGLFVDTTSYPDVKWWPTISNLAESHPSPKVSTNVKLSTMELLVQWIILWPTYLPYTCSKMWSKRI